MSKAAMLTGPPAWRRDALGAAREGCVQVSLNLQVYSNQQVSLNLQVSPYLYFKGACESALNFYAANGLGAIREIRRYAGTPMADRDGGVWRDKVLHSVFEGPGVFFYASDGPDSEPMKGCALLIQNDDPATAGALFAAMSEGGRVTEPFERQFCGDIYGNFTDRFGVQWALICQPKA
jgi:PhnB protein